MTPGGVTGLPLAPIAVTVAESPLSPQSCGIGAGAPIDVGPKRSGLPAREPENPPPGRPLDRRPGLPAAGGNLPGSEACYTFRMDDRLG
ncbi:hypothetical protein OG871_14985 [Kitasatospora sp. NBC_00374]|uniref:hypothetical protein n=1 Tax=Kitasatospora sp. NBC_00374 TaxID=2975964 RepID=UPI0030E17B52